MSVNEFEEVAPTMFIASGLAQVFAADNPNFKSEKFMEACGIRIPNAQ